MATRNWTGAAHDGAILTAGNWDTLPTNGDSIVIATGSEDIVGGASGLNLVNVTVTEGFRFNIGDSANALTFTGISGTTKIVVAGAFVKIGCTGGVGPIAALTVVFRSRGAFSLSTGTATYCHTSGSGTFDITASGVVTTMRINGPTVTAAAGTAFTTVTMGSGQLTTYRSIGTFIGSQCRLITLSAAAISTSATCGGGCTFNHQASSGASVSIASLEMLTGSIFTPQSNTNASFIITSLYRHLGSTFEREWGGNQVTITTEYPI